MKKLPVERINARMSWVAIAGLAVNATYWCRAIISGGLSPTRYDAYRFRGQESSTEWSYPIAEVATWVSVIAGEAIVLSLLLLLGRQKALAGTSFLLAVACGLAFLPFAMMTMHAPLAFAGHTMSLLTSGAWLLLMVPITLITRALLRDPWPEEQVVTSPPEARVVRG